MIFLFVCDFYLSAEEVQSLFVIGFMSVMFVVAIINGQRCVQDHERKSFILFQLMLAGVLQPSKLMKSV